MERTKVLVLFSGGLDSRLVVKLLQEQGLAIEAIYFSLPFGNGCCNDFNCSFKFTQMAGVKLTTVDCTKGKLFEEYLETIKNPRYGYGVAINPCIDCKIFIFKKAKEYADKNDIRIIATGEVLGERPMSQTKHALELIDKKIGFELLRPLSARLLTETQAEKEGLVDRSRFLAINGRGRKIQFSLAKKFNIKFPSPAGGCLLCEKEYKAKLKDIFENQSSFTPEEIDLLKNFRHFRNPNSIGKIILGRNEKENILLEQLNKKLKYSMIIPEEIPGPTAIYEKSEDKTLANQIVSAYSLNDLSERKKFEKIRVKA